MQEKILVVMSVIWWLVGGFGVYLSLSNDHGRSKIKSVMLTAVWMFTPLFF